MTKKYEVKVLWKTTILIEDEYECLSLATKSFIADNFQYSPGYVTLFNDKYVSAIINLNEVKSIEFNTIGECHG